MRRTVVLAALLGAVLLACAPWASRAQGLTVFAAASLTDAMKDANQAWQQAGHPPLTLSFAASSTLARQIEQGAPANVFASADQQWMDELVKRDLIAPGTRRTLLGNALVLVAPKSDPRPVAIAPGVDLLARLGAGGRLAVGDPSNVPAGIYAKQAFDKLGIWQQVQPRLAPAQDVRAALLLVERGEAPLGVVYSTDAATAPGVVVVGTFPESSHDPITYPFALTRTGDTPDARAFLDYLASAQGQAIFAKRGFEAPPPG
ncbi:MAG: molybdate ABC transporter substrate-binding protein [Acidisphaera sp.]|nr:molybdate ABC transporter substrate-binding protein [Acidisphaera sp.]MBV9813322.1 molybdate ABC transporter substrate-binding protein [Acetobacteraceae bacterium]